MNRNMIKRTIASKDKYFYCAFTHHGIDGYENQDSVLINETLLNSQSLDSLQSGCVPGTKFVAAVADGLSASPHAATASRLVLDEVRKHAYFNGGLLIREMDEHIEQRLIAYATIHPEYRGMSSTLAGVVLREGKGDVFNTGDSRVYRFRDKTLKRYSCDHTQAQRMLESGEMTAEAYECRSGIYDMLECYYVAEVLPDADAPLQYVVSITVNKDDILLICTDGLTDAMDDEAIEKVLSEAESVCAAAEVLKERAMAAVEDNLSFVLLRKVDD